jgi:uncharacterized protein YhdP
LVIVFASLREVLVLLGILSQDKCPDWYRLYNPNLEAELQNADFEREQKGWEVSISQSRMRHGYCGTDSLDKIRQRKREGKAREKNKELKLTDAITSQAIDSEKIASAVLVWLQREALLPDLSAKEVVELSSSFLCYVYPILIGLNTV